MLRQEDNAMEFPVLDMADERAGVPGARERLAAELRQALETLGFFCVVNHGIDWARIEESFDAGRRFHARAVEKKMESAFNAQFAGYLPAGGYTIRPSELNDNDRADLNEAYFMERESVPPGIVSERAENFQSPNQWPDDLPGFKQTVAGYFDLMEGFGQSLLPLYALALELPEDYFTAPFRWAQASVRLSHYPPEDRADNQFGIAPHTDAGFLTILPQSDVTGLHIRPPNGDWIKAPKIEQGIFINSGDMLKRWSNDRFLSTQHMAVNDAGIDRYAAVFFYSPDLEYEMACLPTCQDAGNPPKYPPITYREYRDWFMNQNYRDAKGNEAALPPV
jgi:isopenicillin N synthase-like dioxygenase